MAEMQQACEGKRLKAQPARTRIGAWMSVPIATAGCEKHFPVVGERENYMTSRS